jgi:hypothetical protein
MVRRAVESQCAFVPLAAQLLIEDEPEANLALVLIPNKDHAPGVFVYDGRGEPVRHHPWN